MIKAVRLFVLLLVVGLFIGCQKSSQSAFSEGPSLDETSKVRIIKEMLEIDNKAKTLAIRDDVDNYSRKSYPDDKYFYRDPESSTMYAPVRIGDIESGKFVREKNEVLASVKISGLSHAEGSEYFVFAVYDKDVKTIISDKLKLLSAERKIVRGKDKDYILTLAADCGQGYCHWSVSLPSCNEKGKWSEKILFNGEFTDDSPSALKAIKDKGIKAEEPPKISENEIMFPDRKYVWNPVKEAFEKPK
ncbi:MAG: hypothetical protein A2044_06500 [Candidatus Firestonebacteria bacterium GWA2_43_8]|nr:MAG: hypothetical protein A2044_06500 [Candidatus Firestonebacteria bacterium GWA2_43_8]